MTVNTKFEIGRTEKSNAATNLSRQFPSLSNLEPRRRHPIASPPRSIYDNSVLARRPAPP